MQSKLLVSSRVYRRKNKNKKSWLSKKQKNLKIVISINDKNWWTGLVIAEKKHKKIT